MTKAPSLTPDELIRLLKKHGFELMRTKGSHQILKNRGTGKMTIVPLHKRDLPKGTMLAILKQAGIDKEELL
ncbi:MAG: type II toxin-antitoxin system HicA family toxin [Flavobacteriales bacterium]